MSDAVVPLLSSIIPARSQSQRRIRGENTRGGKPRPVVSHKSTGVEREHGYAGVEREHENVRVVKIQVRSDGAGKRKPKRGRYMGKEQVGLGNRNGFNLPGQTDVCI